MKKLLFVLACTLFCFSAKAEDITNPFYMPLKNKGLSDTSVSYAKDTYKPRGGSFTDERTVLNESLMFGLADNLALTGKVGNRFVSGGDDTNVYWGIGGVYALYMQDSPELLMHFGASYAQEGHYRDLEAFARIGYAADMVFLPYAEARFMQPVNHGEANNEPVFSARLAGYSMIKEKVGIRAGFDFVYDHENARQQAYSVFAEAEYVIGERVAVGVSGAYLFHDTGVQSSAFSLGANVKIAF